MLLKAAMKIVTTVNMEKDHIPPITTSEANPFPYQITINPRADSWGARMSLFWRHKMTRALYILILAFWSWIEDTLDTDTQYELILFNEILCMYLTYSNCCEAYYDVFYPLFPYIYLQIIKRCMYICGSRYSTPSTDQLHYTHHCYYGHT